MQFLHNKSLFGVRIQPSRAYIFYSIKSNKCKLRKKCFSPTVIGRKNTYLLKQGFYKILKPTNRVYLFIHTFRTLGK